MALGVIAAPNLGIAGKTVCGENTMLTAGLIAILGANQVDITRRA